MAIFDGFYQVGAKKEPFASGEESRESRNMGSPGFCQRIVPHIASCVDDLTVIRSMVSGFRYTPRIS
jgi:hypothetical protein